jgi:hypothetical protein
MCFAQGHMETVLVLARPPFTCKKQDEGGKIQSILAHGGSHNLPLSPEKSPYLPFL